MHIELIEILRCPAGHEETPLIATIDRLEGRYVAEGSLGCPACGARYPIRDFVADVRVSPWDGAGLLGAALPRAPAGEDGILRLAAMLDARRPGLLYLLAGAWGALAAGLAVSYDVQTVVFNPTPDVRPAEGISIILGAGRVPFASASVQGAAVDVAGRGDDALVAGCIRAVRPGGRVVAPAGHPVPSGLRELARDSHWWVGERSPAASDPIPLTRVRR